MVKRPPNPIPHQTTQLTRLENSKSLRRLAADHGALHNNPLPPNFLFPPTAADTDDLTELDILLAGPLHTPFSSGVWKLHLTIPPEYPQSPPTANFRTPIFHPNVDPHSGGVCVETLKRDWDAKLTLRDVLVTISCLLIQPNPDSALNAEAGALIQEGFEVFERRARLMTSINAGIPRALLEGVREAQTRGQESEVHEDEPERTLLREEGVDSVCKPPAPVRRKRGVARLRSAAASRRSDGSPSGAVGMRRQQQQPGPSSSRPFVTQGSSSGDPFGISIREDPPLGTPQLDPSSDDEDNDDDDNGSATSADQENDTALSPSKPRAAPSKPTTGTPRRPHGAPPVPLGELTLSDPEPSSDDEEAEDSDMEPEYPPSPRKSPSKSPAKKRPQQPNLFFDKPQGSRTAALFGPGARNFTPPNALSQPLATDSPYAGTGGDTTIEDVTMAEPSPSPRKARSGGRLFQTPAKKGGEVRSLFGRPVAAGLPAGGGGGGGGGGVPKPRSPPSSAERRRARDKRFWELCGGDVRKWNRGEFEGESFSMKAARW